MVDLADEVDQVRTQAEREAWPKIVVLVDAQGGRNGTAWHRDRVAELVGQGYAPASSIEAARAMARRGVNPIVVTAPGPGSEGGPQPQPR